MENFIKELTASDVKDNSYIVENVKDGSEIKITIINGTGLEYNGSVIVKRGCYSTIIAY